MTVEQELQILSQRLELNTKGIAELDHNIHALIRRVDALVLAYDRLGTLIQQLVDAQTADEDEEGAIQLTTPAKR